MRILLLDTIHGGSEIGAAFARAGNSVDAVDVYRGTTPDSADRAVNTTYDLVVAPVHLDPTHPLLARRTAREPVISHHEAVRRLLDGKILHPMIEITGAQGKTTTAHALAHLLPGPGILHTSTGTYAMPGLRLLFKKSITPASVLDAAEKAVSCGGWLVAEESLGVTGAGDLAIITSPLDYRCAAGKKSALAEKVASAQKSRQLLVAPGIPAGAHADAVPAGRCCVHFRSNLHHLRVWTFRDVHQPTAHPARVPRAACPCRNRSPPIWVQSCTAFHVSRRRRAHVGQEREEHPCRRQRQQRNHR